MNTISLCMIVKDEEETLPRCLETVKDIVDEIIIVDTGSTDKTKETAKKYTSKIYDFKWIDDFSAARNYSFSKATQDYILWLDADDILLENDRIKLKHLKEHMDSSIDIFMFKYNLGTDDKGRTLCTYYRERLLKRSNNYRWHDPIHEYIPASGKITNVDIAVTHKKVKQKVSRNLSIFKKMIHSGKELSHRNYFYYARELNANGIYDEALIYYEKFLNIDGGLFSNYMDACIDLSKIYTTKGDRRKAIKALLRCFEFGMPRAEICYELGSQYKELKNYNCAIAWYEIASKLKEPEDTLGSVIHDCYNYFPYVEMSLCYFYVGRIQEAVKFNEKAANFRPDSSIVINNRKYFKTLIDNAKKMS